MKLQLLPLKYFVLWVRLGLELYGNGKKNTENWPMITDKLNFFSFKIIFTWAWRVALAYHPQHRWHVLDNWKT